MLCSAETSDDASDLSGRNCGFRSETLAYWAQPASKMDADRVKKAIRGFMVVVRVR